MTKALLVVILMFSLVSDSSAQRQSDECFRCSDCSANQIGNCTVYVDVFQQNPPWWEPDTDYEVHLGRGCDSYGVNRGAMGCTNRPLWYPDSSHPSGEQLGSRCELVQWGCCTTYCPGDNCGDNP